MSLTEFFGFLANPFKYRHEHNTSGDMEGALQAILLSCKNIERGQVEMALNLEALRAEVDRAKTVQESAVTLLHALAAEVGKIAAELAAELEDDNTHVAALEELASKLKASTDSLADGIANSDDVFEVPAQPDPVPEAPVEAPAEVETPVEEVPVEEVPVEEVPVEEVPVVEEPVAEEPVVEAPVEEAPAEEVPAEVPAEEVPVVEEPVAEEVPAEVPVEEVPVDAPVEETPVVE
jgi:hypothetical protein